MLLLLLLLLLLACDTKTTSPDDTAPESLCGVDAQPVDYPLDDVLTLAHVQAKGTHNSFHIEPDLLLDDSHEYTHAPLDVQLAEQGVRQFELDFHLREGGGFEIFHIPAIDEETTCQQFVDCLALVKCWSDASPGHLPVVFWLEPKDDVDELVDDLVDMIGRYDDLEAEILSVWPRERILTPDEVRGAYDTLPEALAANGWPTLGALRGRVIFSLLDSGSHREHYLEGAENLAGKLMFVDADSPDDPWAAFLKVNDARSEEAAERIEQGFIITSNSDGADSSDDENTEKLADSLAAGAHFLSSDYPAPVEGRDFWFEMADGAPARCNPVTAPAECTAEDIEALP